jgi:hypothetical protein
VHYTICENSRRLLDLHIEKASESLLETGIRRCFRMNP